MYLGNTVYRIHGTNAPDRFGPIGDMRRPTADGT
jgi:hypothetical protein